ncbi:MAG: bifunctional DNA primase/polymerase [Candidatus Lokiarchaeota archaeon]|nr:bifunctional DNA primase/polymerase [Candidatus Lokiarchaeota archaeon]
MTDLSEILNLFPLKPNEKVPIGELKNTNYLYETFPKNLFYDYMEKYEGLNVGIACGKVSNGLVVLDFDLKEKRFWSDIEPILKTTFPELLKTYIVSSPHGYHLYYFLDDLTKLPSRQINKNLLYKETKRHGRVFQGVVKTKFPQFLKGLDVLGEGGYVVGAGSVVNGVKYEKISEKSEIHTITRDQLDQLIGSFLEEKPKTIRKAFVDIVSGALEIETYSAEAGKDEFVYWKYLFREAWWRLGCKPEDLYEFLEKSQPSFDEKTCELQLKHHPYTDLPLTKEKYAEYFPTYKKTPKTSLSTTEPFDGSTPSNREDLKRKKLDYAVDCRVNEKTPNCLLLEFTPEETPNTMVNYEVRDIVLNEMNIKTRMREDSDSLVPYLYENGYWKPHSQSKIKKKIRWVFEFFALKDSRNAIDDVFEAIKSETLTEDKEFDSNPFELNLINGILNLRTGEFFPHTPEKLHTKRIPVIYDPQAPCPLIDKFLSEVFTAEDQPLIRQFCGLCLTDLMIYQKALMLYGDGNNGKTTFISLLTKMVGSKNSANMDLGDFGKGHKSSVLVDKLLVFCSDIDATYKIPIRNFKIYVGNESKILVDPKFIQPYQITPTAKLVFSCNTKMPEVPEDTDKGFWRKWIILECPNDFSDNIDETLLEKLTTPGELSGFLNQCLAGLKILIEKGGFDEKYYDWIAVKDFWLSKFELVNGFIEKTCEVESSLFVECDWFYQAYNQWLRDEHKKPISKTLCTQQLGRLGYPKKRKSINKVMVWCYVGLGAIADLGNQQTKNWFN